MDFSALGEFSIQMLYRLKALRGVFLSLKAFLVDCPVFLNFSSFCKLK